jgi:hypothetical protein
VSYLSGATLRREDERASPSGDNGEQFGTMMMPAIVTCEEQPVSITNMLKPHFVVNSAIEPFGEGDDVDSGIAESESYFGRIN